MLVRDKGNDVEGQEMEGRQDRNLYRTERYYLKIEIDSIYH
jgi:hypothetical protein